MDKIGVSSYYYSYVTNVSAEKTASTAHSWFFEAEPDLWRTACFEAPPTEGTEKTRCLMLAKKYKLPLQSFAGKSGNKSLRTPYFAIKVFSAIKAYSRFGAVISAKVSKKAVDRNRIRRSIFQWLQIHQSQLPVADYVIIVFPEAARLPEEAISIQLRKLFS